MKHTTDIRQTFERMMEQGNALQLISMDGFWSADTTGQFLQVNDAYCRLTGYSRDELLAMNIRDVELVEDAEAVTRHIEKIIQIGLDRFETRHRCKDGSVRDLEINCSFNQAHDGRFYTFIRDITEHKRVKHELGDLNHQLEKQIEQRTEELLAANRSLEKEIIERKNDEAAQKAMIETLRICNEIEDLREFMSTTAFFFQQQSGCEAVGIRLREGDDFPYFETRGFPDEFVQMENSLCSLDEQGRLIRDYTGNPVLDCMCGNVLCGRFDQSQPFFTRHGSFWSSDTSELLASTTEENRQARTRNRCNGEGYQSVALLPFRFRGYTYGLIQLNDRRTGCFTSSKIANYESLVDCIAIALAKRMSDEALRTNTKKAEDNLRSYNDKLRNLTAHVEETRENERKRIAREIHDQLGQSLMALKYHNSWIQHKFASDAVMVAHLAKMESIVDSSMASIQDICRNLRPQLLDDIGLLAAIDWQAKEFRKSSNIRLRLSVEKKVHALSFSNSESTSIFRIFQEALTNIMRHSQATQVRAEVSYHGNRLYVRIADNGRGITDSELASCDSFGLQGMMERVLSFKDGRLDIRRLKRKGTEVELSLIVEAQTMVDEERCHAYTNCR